MSNSKVKVVVSFVILTCFCLFCPAFSQVDDALYQGEAKVASHSSADWSKALQVAFRAVLIRVSGNPNIANVPAVRSALVKPDRFVQSYNYLGHEGALSVQIRFSPKLVSQLLKNAGQFHPVRAGPAKPLSTPPMLIWLVRENSQGEPEALSRSDPVAVAFGRSAKAAGMVPVWPMMDFEDLTNVPAGVLWDQDVTVIRQNAKRYRLDTVVVGRLSGPSKYPTGVEWLLLAPNEAQAHWQDDAWDPTKEVRAIISHYGQINAKRNEHPSVSSPGPDATESSIEQDSWDEGPNSDVGSSS